MGYANLMVTDVMSSQPICGKQWETVGKADADMRLADIRHLPVVDERDHLLGILSDRDVGKALARARGKSLRLDEVMTTDVLTVRPSTLAREATWLMLDHKIGSLPVVDDQQRLVGIVTETDFLRLAHQVLGGGVMASDEEAG